MSKYIDVDRLKELLDTEYKEYVNKSKQTYAALQYQYIADGLDIAEQLIDSHQQEQPKVDLEVRKRIEELANDWHHKGFASDEDCPLCMQDLMDILWHFYELGKKNMKEQMLKDAVEGYVNYYEDSGGKLMAEAQVGCPYHIGDKVKIIIVKEENK